MEVLRVAYITYPTICREKVIYLFLIMKDEQIQPVYVGGFVYYTKGAKTKGLPSYTKDELSAISSGFTKQQSPLPLCLYHEESLVVGEVIDLFSTDEGLYCCGVINRSRALRDFTEFHRRYAYSDDKFTKDELYMWRVLCPQLSMCNSTKLALSDKAFLREISLVGTGARTGTCAQYGRREMDVVPVERPPNGEMTCADESCYPFEWDEKLLFMRSLGDRQIFRREDKIKYDSLLNNIPLENMLASTRNRRQDDHATGEPESMVLKLQRILAEHTETNDGAREVDTERRLRALEESQYRHPSTGQRHRYIAPQSNAQHTRRRHNKRMPLKRQRYDDYEDYDDQDDYYEVYDDIEEDYDRRNNDSRRKRKGKFETAPIPAHVQAQAPAPVPAPAPMPVPIAAPAPTSASDRMLNNIYEKMNECIGKINQITTTQHPPVLEPQPPSHPAPEPDEEHSLQHPTADTDNVCKASAERKLPPEIEVDSSLKKIMDFSSY